MSTLPIPLALAHGLRIRSPRTALLMSLSSALGGRDVPFVGGRLSWYAWKMGGVGRTVTIDGLRITLPPDIDAVEVGEARLQNYENAERFAVARYLPTHLPVVEFGGSVGVVACLANRQLRAPRQHVVVEAHPDIALLLEINRQQNLCGFSVINAAVAYDEPAVHFSAARAFVAGTVTNEPTASTIEVNTTSLAAATAGLDGGDCSLICDIEGAEWELVRHEHSLIARRVHTMVLETHPGIYGRRREAMLLRDLRSAGLEACWHYDDVWCLRRPPT